MTIAMSDEEFYKRRDDRTNRLTESFEYQHLRVRVMASKDTVHSFAGQVQLL